MIQKVINQDEEFKKYLRLQTRFERSIVALVSALNSTIINGECIIIKKHNADVVQSRDKVNTKTNINVIPKTNFYNGTIPSYYGSSAETETMPILLNYYRAYCEHVSSLFLLKGLTSMIQINAAVKELDLSEQVIYSAKNFFFETPNSVICDKIPSVLLRGGLHPHILRQGYVFNEGYKKLYSKLNKGEIISSNDVDIDTFFDTAEMDILIKVNAFIFHLDTIVANHDPLEKDDEVERLYQVALFELDRRNSCIPLSHTPFTFHVDHKINAVKAKGSYGFFNEEAMKTRLERLSSNLSEKMIESGLAKKIVVDHEGLTVKMLSASGFSFMTMGNNELLNPIAKIQQSKVGYYWYEDVEKLNIYEEVLGDWFESQGFSRYLIGASNVSNRLQRQIKDEREITQRLLVEAVVVAILEELGAKIRAMFMADGGLNAAARIGDVVLKTALIFLDSVAKSAPDMLSLAVDYIERLGPKRLEKFKTKHGLQNNYQVIRKLFKSIDVSRFDNSINIDIYGPIMHQFILPLLSNLDVNTASYEKIRSESRSIYTDLYGQVVILVHNLQKLDSGVGNTSEVSKIAVNGSFIPDFLCSKAVPESQIDEVIHKGFFVSEDDSFFLGGFGDDFSIGTDGENLSFEPFEEYLQERGIKITTESVFAHLAHFVDVIRKEVFPSCLSLSSSVLYPEHEKIDKVIVELAMYTRLYSLRKNPFLPMTFSIFTDIYTLRTGLTLRDDWMTYSFSTEFKDRVKVAVSKSVETAKGIMDLVNWMYNGDWNSISSVGSDSDDIAPEFFRDILKSLVPEGNPLEIDLTTLWSIKKNPYSDANELSDIGISGDIHQKWELLFAKLQDEGELTPGQYAYLKRVRDSRTYEEVLTIQIEWLVMTLHNGRIMGSVPDINNVPDVTFLTAAMLK